MESKSNIYQSEDFRREIKKCNFFRLKYPRGGQYNDGYELLGKIILSDGESLLKTLDTLGVKYTLHAEKPETWCPPSFFASKNKYWLEYSNRCNCLGYNTYITIGTSTDDYSVEFNFNSTSWFEVVLKDVVNAIKFEQVLVSHGLL